MARFEIREERPEDVVAIRALTALAFRDSPHSAQTEALIIDALREADALTLSLVAADADLVIGHLAFSPVSIGGRSDGWFGLGPVSVRPDRQRRGIGSALIRNGMDRLKRMGAKGCVVLGDPAYYRRFGFETDPALRYGNVDPTFFQSLNFTGDRVTGEVAYHPGFGAS